MKRVYDILVVLSSVTGLAVIAGPDIPDRILCTTFMFVMALFFNVGATRCEVRERLEKIEALLLEEKRTKNVTMVDYRE